MVRTESLLTESKAHSIVVWKDGSETIHVVGNLGDTGNMLKVADGANINAIEYGLFSSDAYFARLWNPTTEGSLANNTSGHGLFVDNSGSGRPRNSHIEDVFFRNAAGDGMHLEETHGYRLTSFLTEANTSNGMTVTGGSDTDEMHFNGVFALINGGDGIHLDNVEEMLGEIYTHPR